MNRLNGAEIQRLGGKINWSNWISSIGALAVAVIAFWSLAAQPTEARIKDHEKRIRALEGLAAEELAVIEQRLSTVTRDIERLRRRDRR